MSNSKRKAHCNKAKHPTLLAAQIVLRKTLTRASKRGAPIVTMMRAYKCEYCDGYHVGRDRTQGINWAAVKREDERLAALRS